MCVAAFQATCSCGFYCVNRSLAVAGGVNVNNTPSLFVCAQLKSHVPQPTATMRLFHKRLRLKMFDDITGNQTRLCLKHKIRVH